MLIGQTKKRRECYYDIITIFALCFFMVLDLRLRIYRVSG